MKSGTNKLTIYLQGGMCNYLRVLFYHLAICKKKDLALDVIWSTDRSCQSTTSHFLDCFTNLEGVNFLPDKGYPARGPSFVDYSGDGSDLSWTILRSLDYSELQPIDPIKKIIKNKIETLGPDYSSAHIRRTDFGTNINLPPYEKYFSFFNSLPENNIYLSTDNKETYSCFLEKYPRSIKFPYHNTIPNARRHTSMHDSVIDLFMCVFSKNFLGTPHSSFSDLIETLRNSKYSFGYEKSS